jgi:hypothetical protein
VLSNRHADDETGERKRFSSKILAPWCRKSPKISEVLPLLNLHGLSSGDFVPALEQFLSGTGVLGVRLDGTKELIALAEEQRESTESLLAFYDFPAKHWIHLPTTNPNGSTFSTVKLRTKVTRGAGSPAAALAMVFKLAESARARRRAITGASLVALVRAGAKFENGVLVERTQADAA